MTSQELPELLNQNCWHETRAKKGLKVWLVYNKGKSLAYVWDEKRLSAHEARKKAELQLLLM